MTDDAYDAKNVSKIDAIMTFERKVMYRTRIHNMYLSIDSIRTLCACVHTMAQCLRSHAYSHTVHGNMQPEETSLNGFYIELLSYLY